jgi:hypothetical protein
VSPRRDNNASPSSAAGFRGILPDPKRVLAREAGAAWREIRYPEDMTTRTDADARPFAQVRAFFAKDEAPIRVTLVIVVCAIGVLLVAMDTAQRSKATPPASSTTTTSPASTTR